MKTLTKFVGSGYFAADVEPALWVEGGERFCIEAPSLLTEYPDGKVPSPLPVVGPVYVKGANARTTLRVDVEQIELTGKGVVMAVPGIGPLGSDFTERVRKVLSYDDRFIQFNERIRLPVHKMIGKLGTAPRGDPVRCDLPGHHGGNMDNNHVTEGCSVYLPVYVDGAFLYAGDLHAGQGDGEMVTGIETEGRMVLHCDVYDDLLVSDPVVVTSTDILCTGVGKTLEEAARIAARNTVNLLMAEWGLTFGEAYILCGIASDLRITQVYNPLVGIKVVTPLSVLPVSSRWKGK